MFHTGMKIYFIILLFFSNGLFLNVYARIFPVHGHTIPQTVQEMNTLRTNGRKTSAIM